MIATRVRVPMYMTRTTSRPILHHNHSLHLHSLTQSTTGAVRSYGTGSGTGSGMRSFLERWFTVPKGFKKFYPKEGKGPSGSGSASEAGAKKAKEKGAESE